MIIILENEQKNLSHTFADMVDFINITGSRPNNNKYIRVAEENEVDWLLTKTGLVDGGSTVENNLQTGVNQDGASFYANAWSSITWSLTYKPSYSGSTNNLRRLLRYKNNPLKVTILSGDVEYIGYFILDSKNIESGEITFVSAYADERAYWYAGTFNEKFYFRNKGTETLHRNIPNITLGSTKVDGELKINIDSEIDTPMTITFQNIFDGDESDDVTFTHTNTSNSYKVYCNGEPNNTQIYNTEQLTHTINGVTSTHPRQYMSTTGGNDEFVLSYSPDKTMTNSAYVQIQFEMYVIGVL